MKKILLIVVSLSLAFSLAAQEVKEPRIDASPLDMSTYRVKDGDNVKNYARVIYSRPQVKGREVFGKLVPYGQVWRTGANEATEIQFYKPVTIAGEKVPAGTYEMFTVPGEKNWSVILNIYQNSWGTYGFKDGNSINKFTVPAVKTTQKFEYFSIYFLPGAKDGMTTMVMAWDDTLIKIPMVFEEE